MGWTESMGKTKLIQLGKYYYPEPGGMETHLYDLCSQLKDKFDIQVFAANTKPKTITEIVDGVIVTRIANWGQLFSSPICPTFPYHLSRLNGDRDTIIQLHMPNPMAHIAYCLAKPSGRLIVMWHSDIIRQKTISKFFYNKHLFHLLDCADCIIATSPNYVKYSAFLKEYADKCVVVPLGINPEKFENSRAVQLSATMIRQKYGNRIVLFVGRFTYYKGLEILLKSAKDVNGKILLVGDGPLKNKIKKLIKRLNLGSKVFLIHHVSHEELVSFYHACDIFVLPSNRRSEAFGVVQLEAMICCKPPISTNLKTGVPWVNLNEKTGLIIPENEPAKLTEAINYLLENEDIRRRLGKTGRLRVLENFTLNHITSKMERIYERVLNGGVRMDELVPLSHET
jgi:rhamnosyl/mannosyltransferase